VPTKSKPQVQVERLTPQLCACGRQAEYRVLKDGKYTSICTFHYKGMMKNYTPAATGKVDILDIRQHPLTIEGSNYVRGKPPEEEDTATDLDITNMEKKYDKFNGEVKMARWIWDVADNNRKILVDRKNNFYVVKRGGGNEEDGKYLFRADGVAIAKLDKNGKIAIWLVSPELRSKHDRIGSELKAAKKIVADMQSADIARTKVKTLKIQSSEGVANPLKPGDKVRRYVGKRFSFDATVSKIIDGDHVSITTKNDKTIDVAITSLHLVDSTGGATKVIPDEKKDGSSMRRWALCIEGKGWLVSETATLGSSVVLEKHRCLASATYFPDQRTYLAKHDSLYMIVLDRKGQDMVIFPYIREMSQEYIGIVKKMKKMEINKLPKIVRDSFPEFIESVKNYRK
jgi:hypothetical protein